MRQKPANEDAVKRMILFLNAAKVKAESGSATPSYADLQIQNQVSRNAFTSAKRLQILLPIPDSNKFKWNEEAKPNRILALKVLDDILHKNKKQVHTPLMPELTTTIGLLDKIIDRFDHTTILLESAVKRLKQPSNQEAETAGTLFTETDQYKKDFIYLAGQIANGCYSDDVDSCEYSNNFIIKATSDLLTKINNHLNSKHD